MNALNLGSDDEPVKKKKSNTRNLKIALGLAAVILIPTIGSTLAGSITVGTGAVEFGQGVVTTAACDTAITVTPTSVLTAGSFKLDVVTVSGVAAECDGKYFTIKVLDSSNVAQEIGTINATFCKIQFDKDSTFTTIPATCGTISGTSTADTFAFTTATEVGSIGVAKITLESTSA